MNEEQEAGMMLVALLAIVLSATGLIGWLIWEVFK